VNLELLAQVLDLGNKCFWAGMFSMQACDQLYALLDFAVDILWGREIRSDGKQVMLLRQSINDGGKFRVNERFSTNKANGGGRKLFESDEPILSGALAGLPHNCRVGEFGNNWAVGAGVITSPGRVHHDDQAVWEEFAVVGFQCRQHCGREKPLQSEYIQIQHCPVSPFSLNAWIVLHSGVKSRRYNPFAFLCTGTSVPFEYLNKGSETPSMSMA
jgi:hypothetical protein